MQKEEDFDKHPALGDLMINLARIETRDPWDFLCNYMNTLIHKDKSRKCLLESAYQLIPLRERVDIVQAAIKANFDQIIPELCNLAPEFGVDEIEEVTDGVTQLEDNTYLQALNMIRSAVEKKRATKNRE